MTKEAAYIKIEELVIRFTDQIGSYTQSDYNETQTRRNFIDPFFKALGWDVDNENGNAEAYREVIHEDKIKIGKATKAPDYSFRLSGGKRLFFVEAKKPSVFIKDEVLPAYQVRRYGWSAKLAISIITDFEEFAIYDCSKKPLPTDKAAVARIKYLKYKDYLNEFNFIWDTFSKEKVLKGSFDKFVQGTANKKGTSTVDKAFLETLDNCRTILAESIAKLNPALDEDEINFAVQQTIDRIIFLRIAEDRSIEPYGKLQESLKFGNYYTNLFGIFKIADDKYNSGLFNFKKDTISENLQIDNKVLKTIINQFYYPECPYEFSVLSVEILGSAYEQFLGKTITINKNHKAVIELKPEVRKAGGVYYTPQYIVDYIVENTLGKLTQNKTPKQIAELKVVDPACGSGSFLIGAYQHLLNYHSTYYQQNETQAKKDKALTPTGSLCTSIKKQILLNNIYGVDIDVNAVEVTKLSLLLKCMEGETQASITNQASLFNERVLPTLDDNIKSGNSLIDTDYYDTQLDFGEEKKIKPFNWQKAFPTVFNRNVEIDYTLPYKKQYHKILKNEDDTNKLINNIVSEPALQYNKKQNGGFDCVIGNPPYVKVSDNTMIAYFNNTYHHQDYQQDLYLLFLEQYSNLLITQGKLGIIIPNTWLQSIKFKNIRRYLVNNYHWYKILHCKDKVFNAVVDTHVLVFEKNNFIKNSNLQIEVCEKTVVSFLREISQYNLPNDGEIINILANKEDKKLFEKIKSNSLFIGDECFSNVGVKPFQVGKGNPKQTREIVDEKPYVKENVAKPKGKNWLPLMRGSLMNRYTNFWNNNSWIKYGEWLAEPRDASVFEAKEKIIVRQTSDKIIATIIGESIICRNNIHVIISHKTSHQFLLGVLNSKLTNFYYYQINPERGEALAEVKKSHIEQLPIPIITKQNKHFHNQIENYVNQLLQLNIDLQTTTLETKKEHLNNKIDYCENKINELVYQLYNLTPAEIKIVECN
ncbi:MAG: N-6 DNA methylase [Flavobacterium sp.]|nr:N-6 DNA methylase [Flavobacterium sp.]